MGDVGAFTMPRDGAVPIKRDEELTRLSFREDEMGTTVVYVHGNGNKIREDLLKSQWDVALFGQDMGSLSRMAYWARVRYPEPLSDLVSDEIELLPVSPLDDVAAPPAVEPAEAFIAQTLREVAAWENVDMMDLGLESWLRDMTYTADALAAGENITPPQTSSFEALPFPQALRIRAFRELTRRTFVDVFAYFFGGFKEQMRQVVRDALAAAEKPVVVLGHSLGSIIAYDVLRERRSSSLQVPLFVTVGSPLGVAEVQDLVERPLEVPASVAAWLNASDARDMVALDHTIRPEYAPPEKCTDVYVVNDSDNHHGIGEYLRTVAVRQPILELVRR